MRVFGRMFSWYERALMREIEELKRERDAAVRDSERFMALADQLRREAYSHAEREHSR